MAKPINKGTGKGSSSGRTPIKTGVKRDYRPWLSKETVLTTSDWLKKIRHLETMEDYATLHARFTNEIIGRKRGTIMPEATVLKLMEAFEAKEKLLDTSHYERKKKPFRK
jgi:hypothetical protein